MHYLDSPEVLEFVGSARCEELSALGTTCPDHFLRTKVRPLVIPFQPGVESAADIVGRIGPLVERYASDYAGVLRALQAARTRRRCAIRTRC